MEEKFKITINEKEDYALNMIKGLPESAHYMVILSKDTGKGSILEGSQKTFEELLSTLHEEIDERLSPRSRIPHLYGVIDKIESLFYGDDDDHLEIL